MARCCRKVIRYLLHTSEVGIGYSPSQEKNFYSSCRDILKHHENESTKIDVESDIHTFSDASFASTFVDLKSVAGSLVLFRSFPFPGKGKLLP